MSDVNWANAVSMVATADGLLVTERGADGQVGAAASSRLLKALQTATRPGPGRNLNQLSAVAPWDRPVRDAVLDYANQKKLPAKPQLPMTPEEFDDRFPPSQDPFGGDAKMSCTDSALKTYRWFIVQPKVLKKFGEPTPVRQFVSPPFKSCSDADALDVFPGLFMDEAFGFCIRLERLNAQPGYASAWVKVKTICKLPAGSLG